jgi:hypothetical protein
MKNRQKVKSTTEQEISLNPEPEAHQHGDEPIDEKAEINRLLDEGYRVKQIIELGFNRRTAYHYAKLRMQPENDPAGSGQGDGTSGGQPGKGKQELIKLGSKDVIPPEAVLDVLHLPRNGDAVEVWRSGVLDGVGMLLLGARYSQLTAAGQAEIVKSQLDIMREAKESSKDIARQAAEETAARTAQWLDGRLTQLQSQKPDIAQSPHPMQAVFARTLEMYLQGVMSKFLPGAGGPPPEGEIETRQEDWG